MRSEQDGEICGQVHKWSRMLDNRSNQRYWWVHRGFANRQTADKFHFITSQVEEALSKISYNKLDISEEVREQIALVHVQFKRAKAKLESLDSQLQTDLSIVKKEKEPEIEVLKRLSEMLQLKNVNDLKKESLAIHDMFILTGGVPDESFVTMSFILRMIKDIVMIGSPDVDTFDGEMSLIRDRSPVIPDDFRCPISLELMKDPVIVSTGQEQCSGSLCHFGRGFSSDKSVCIIVGIHTLRKLIVSSRPRWGPHAQEGFHVFFHNPWNAASVIMVSALPCMRFLRPMTCLLERSEEESNWSSLPLLLLWMIKDRLDFFNNANIALVCRHWWQASINNPNKLQTVGDDGIPWIMTKSKAAGGNWCMREFINLKRTKKISVEMPEFPYCYHLFSKKGWILFTHTQKEFRAPQVEDSFFLLNPLTKGKIQVSNVVIDDPKGFYLHRGCFSIGQDGFPNSVVICYTDFKTVRLYITTITYPPPVGGGCEGESSSCDQVVWMNTSCAIKGLFGRATVSGMTIINSQVYIWCNYGEMVIYDKSDGTWKEIAAPPLNDSCRRVYRLIEREGDLVLFVRPADEWLFKYSHAHNSWQRMANNGDDAINNLMIFVGLGQNNLVVPITKGLYNYMLSYEQRGKICRLHYYDYLLETMTTLLLMNNVEARWVDLG